MVNEIKRDTVDYRDPTPFDNSKLQSLSDISKAIRHKTYGVDTREALAQQGEALAKLMQETGGNQSAEVAAARGGYETLGIREDAQDNSIASTNSNLAKKADKMAVASLHSATTEELKQKRDKSSLISRGDMDTGSDANKLGMNNLSDEVHQAMSGNAPVNPTIPNGSITTEKYADGSVSFEKLSEATSTANLTIAKGGVFTITDDESVTLLTVPDLFATINGHRNAWILAGDNDEHTFDISAINNKGGLILLNPETKLIRAVDSATKPAKNEWVIGGCWYNGQYYFNHPDASIIVNGKMQLDSKLNRSATISMAASDYIDIKYTSEDWILTLPKIAYITAGNGQQFFINAEDAHGFSLSPIVNKGGYVTYDADNKVVNSYTAATLNGLGLHEYIIGQCWYNGNFVFNGTSQVREGSFFRDRFGTIGKLMTDGKLIVDTKAKTFINDGSNYIVAYGEKMGFKPTWNFDLCDPSTAPGYALYDTVTNVIHLVNQGREEEAGLSRLSVLIGVYWLNGVRVDLFTESPYVFDGISYNTEARNVLNGKNLIALGDSITHGYNGSDTSTMPSPYPNEAANRIGFNLTNVAVNQATISGSETKDLSVQVAGSDFSKFNYVILALGVNDYFANADIELVKTKLRVNLDIMFSANAELWMYGLLPLPSYRAKNGNDMVDGYAYDIANGIGKTLSDYCDEIKNIYNDYQIPVLDWREQLPINDRNFSTVTIDRIHPTVQTHIRLGQRVAEFISRNC